MSTIATFPATAQLGVGYAGLSLTQVTGRLTDGSFQTVAGPYHPDLEKGFGTYVFEAVDVPDTWDGGFWLVSPDGGATELPLAVWPGMFGLPRTGLGEQLLTVTAHNAGGDPLEGVLVTVLSGGKVYRVGESAADGTLSLGLKPGTYALVASLGMVTASQSITVPSNANLAVTVTLATPSPSLPLAPGLCTVAFRARDGGAALRAGCTVEAHLDTTGLHVSDALLSLESRSAATDVLGYAELQLIQGGQILPAAADRRYDVRVTDPEGKTIARKRVLVPDADSANFWEL